VVRAFLQALQTDGGVALETDQESVLLNYIFSFVANSDWECCRLKKYSRKFFIDELFLLYLTRTLPCPKFGDRSLK
jgi:hypothetical protein